MYTTNAIESLNNCYKKLNRGRKKQAYQNQNFNMLCSIVNVFLNFIIF